MDPALYTLIGALGGVLITQISNYLLEDKRLNTQKELKIVDIDHQWQIDIMRVRRIAYSKYFESIDIYRVNMNEGLQSVVGNFYEALMVASEETSKHIKSVFSQIKNDKIDVDAYLEAKKQLLMSMQNDLQKQI